MSRSTTSSPYAIRLPLSLSPRVPLPPRVQPRNSGTTRNQRLVALLRERARSSRRAARGWLVSACASTLAGMLALACAFVSLWTGDRPARAPMAVDPMVAVLAYALGALALLLIAGCVMQQRTKLRAATLYDARARALSMPAHRET